MLSKEEIESRLTVIRKITENLERASVQVNAFVGQKGSKEYLMLDDMLMGILLELDKVDTMGSTVVRQARKRTVLATQQLHDLLEQRQKDREKREKNEQYEIWRCRLQYIKESVLKDLTDNPDLYTVEPLLVERYRGDPFAAVMLDFVVNKK